MGGLALNTPPDRETTHLDTAYAPHNAALGPELEPSSDSNPSRTYSRKHGDIPWALALHEAAAKKDLTSPKPPGPLRHWRPLQILASTKPQPGRSIPTRDHAAKMAPVPYS